MILSLKIMYMKNHHCCNNTADNSTVTTEIPWISTTDSLPMGIEFPTIWKYIVYCFSFICSCISLGLCICSMLLGFIHYNAKTKTPSNQNSNKSLKTLIILTIICMLLFTICNIS
eukprot:269753_1